MFTFALVLPLLFARCETPPSASQAQAAKPGAPVAAQGQGAKPGAPVAAPATATFDHSALDALLKKHVKGLRVDYKSLKADRAALDGYCESLAKLPKAELEKMERNEQFAFWIDAYNALTLQTIVNHYPIEPSKKAKPGEFPKNSIRQIDDAWTAKHTVASQSVSLDEIENKILRPTFKDPRVHFAINCASMSCPPLRPEAFTGAKLQKQLDDNVAAFLAGAGKPFVVPDRKHLLVSKIFDWFKEDFGGEKGVLEFLRDRSPKEPPTEVAAAEERSLTYAEYDWTLNDL